MRFLFNKTENSTAIKCYHVLIESFIGVFVFSIFFCVFMIYFFMDMETSYLVAFIKKSISYYKIISVPQNYKLPHVVSTNTQQINKKNNSTNKTWLIIFIVFIILPYTCNKNEPFRNLVIIIHGINRVYILHFHFASKTNKFSANIVQHFDVFGYDKLTTRSKHSVSFS